MNCVTQSAFDKLRHNAFNNKVLKRFASIDKETVEARKANISGTPTFVLGKTEKDFIVGKRIVGAKPMAEFDRQISQLVRQLVTEKK